MYCVLLQYTIPLRCLEKSVRSMGVGIEGRGAQSPNNVTGGGLGAPPPIMVPRTVKRKKNRKVNWNDLSNVYVAVTFEQNKQFWIKDVCLGNLCLCLVAHNVGNWVCTFLILFRFSVVFKPSRMKLVKI